MEPSEKSALEAVEVEPTSESTPLSVMGGLPRPNWPPQTVGDLMTRLVITLDENEPLGDLEAGMKHFRFRHLPVLSGGKKLVGLISKSDFLHALLGTAPDGTPLTGKIDPNTHAGTIMRRNVVTARMDSSLETACQVMLQEKLSCLPVILEDTTLVGILTETDFVRLIHKQMTKLGTTHLSHSSP